MEALLCSSKIATKVAQGRLLLTKLTETGTSLGSKIPVSNHLHAIIGSLELDKFCQSPIGVSNLGSQPWFGPGQGGSPPKE